MIIFNPMALKMTLYGVLAILSAMGLVELLLFLVYFILENLFIWCFWCIFFSVSAQIHFFLLLYYLG